MADTPDLSEMINKLTADPEMLGRIMNMASAIMGNMPEQKPQEPKEAANKEESPKLNVDMLPLLLGNLGGGKTESGAHTAAKHGSQTALLTALKPYMSSERSEKIDTIIKVLKLAEIAGGILGNKELFKL